MHPTFVHPPPASPNHVFQFSSPHKQVAAKKAPVNPLDPVAVYSSQPESISACHRWRDGYRVVVHPIGKESSDEYKSPHSAEVRSMSVSHHGSTSGKRNEPNLGETRDRLQGALQQSRKAAGSNVDTSGGDSAPLAFDTVALVEQAEPGIAALREWLQGNATLDESQEDINDLRVVVDEASNLLETVDLPALPDTIEVNELPSAIEGKEVPRALVTGKLTDPVDFHRLNELVDYGKLLQMVDFRALIKQKAKFDNALSKGSSENEDTSETADQDSKAEFSSGDGLKAAYKTVHEKSTALDEKISTSGKRSPTASTMHSTIPSERPDIRGTSRFSTVPSR